MCIRDSLREILYCSGIPLLQAPFQPRVAVPPLKIQHSYHSWTPECSTFTESYGSSPLSSVESQESVLTAQGGATDFLDTECTTCITRCAHDTADMTCIDSAIMHAGILRALEEEGTLRPERVPSDCGDAIKGAEILGAKCVLQLKLSDLGAHL